MKHYISPSVTEQHIQNLSILCGSDRVDSNIGIHGCDNSGDAASAFWQRMSLILKCALATNLAEHIFDYFGLKTQEKLQKTEKYLDIWKKYCTFAPKF